MLRTSAHVVRVDDYGATHWEVEAKVALMPTFDVAVAGAIPVSAGDIHLIWRVPKSAAKPKIADVASVEIDFEPSPIHFTVRRADGSLVYPSSWA